MATALVAATVLVVAGLLVIRLIERDQRRQLDADLVQQAQTVARPISRIAARPLGELLQQSAAGVDGDRTIRVLDGSTGAVILAVGSPLPVAFGLLPDGLSTQSLAGSTYRADTVEVPAIGVRSRLLGRAVAPTQVQVLSPTSSIQLAARSVRRRVLVVDGGALIAIVLITLLVTGRELRPLRRLVEVAGRVRRDEDLTVRAPTEGPPEVHAVSSAFNAMLGRIEAAAAARLQALQAARSFVADAAHELRTPLTSIGANLDLLDGASVLDPTVVAALAADHARIIGTLDALHALTMGDLTAPNSEPIDLADLAELAARDTSRHPRLRVTVDAPPDPVVVRGDREALRMVIDNLLTNAERHARESGDTAVRIALAGDGPWWRLSVDDDGVGFPAEGADQLLDRFARGPTSAAGSGLGLAIVAQQVRRHSGTITLRRSPWGGAGIDVRLPATPHP